MAGIIAPFLEVRIRKSPETGMQAGNPSFALHPAPGTFENMKHTKGYVANIEELSLTNEYFRQVLYTDSRLQLVLMSLLPNEDIGEEVHQLDQFIRIEKGSGKSVLDGQESDLSAGSVVVIPQGTRHNIINTSADAPLKIYTLYAPPNHKDGTIHKTKAAADKEEHADEAVK